MNDCKYWRFKFIFAIYKCFNYIKYFNDFTNKVKLIKVSFHIQFISTMVFQQEFYLQKKYLFIAQVIMNKCSNLLMRNIIQ